MQTDILIVGSGGREHALGWKLAQSKRAGKIYFAPGNAGTAAVGQNVPIPTQDIAQLAKFASDHHIGLTVVGPDEPLSLGIVDLFEKKRLRIFGPSKEAARIEWSKSFAKQVLQEAHIPTAGYRSFSDAQAAREYLRGRPLPIVIKASGLADGKGVYICDTIESAQEAVDNLMVKKIHADAGSEIVIEEYLTGIEISIHALCDGVNYALFPAAQDHKRIGEHDTGKNTGGMGVITPVPSISADVMFEIEKKIIQPLLAALRARGIIFKGVLFPGIILTSLGPKVIEINARFGDPECQAYVRLMENDLLDILDDCVDGGIGSHPLRWAAGSAVHIVLASAGYPDEYRIGAQISGLEKAATVPHAILFHANTSESGGFHVAGGRVLGVSTIGTPLSRALDLAYEAADMIEYDGKYLRRDIGAKELR